MLEIYTDREGGFLAKIAVALERALAQRALSGAAGRATPHRLAQDEGWTVSDVLCTSGPQERPFEESHSGFTITIIAAGSFQYRGALPVPGVSRDLMTPGSILLGRPGQVYECGHDHSTGDRCISFGYAPDYLERIAADAGLRNEHLIFKAVRVPQLRATSALVARVCCGLIGQREAPWEEIGLQLAVQVLQLISGISSEGLEASPSTLARVMRTLRMIERDPGRAHTIRSLAREAGLSPYHFLRAFQQVTGVTPHQYILRARLREAAMRLTLEPARILDIAFDCGFGDVSNFNRAFRAEFGASPRGYRRDSDTALRRASRRGKF